jgi:hypothetical protein
VLRCDFQQGSDPERCVETNSNAPNTALERTAHSAGSVCMRGSVPVGRRSAWALGCGMAVVVRILEALLGAFLIAGLFAPNET